VAGARDQLRPQSVVVPLRITRYDAADAAVVITCPEPGITVVRLAVTQHEWEDASCDVWLSAEEARHLARLLARAADSLGAA